MLMRTIAIVAAVSVLLCGFGPAAVCEVSVKTDRKGDYQMTQVTTSGGRSAARVWSVVGRSPGKRALNPEGDRNGDLWPSIAEHNLAPHHPLVVWSRYNGSQYDLAWSRWERTGWEPVRWVHEGDGQGDDLDADVAFDPVRGRPFLVWWRNENGTGRVYLSVFLASEWLAPYQISEQHTDGRFPRIEFHDGGEIRVQFETPAGTVSQLVTFNEPVTITDDINPHDHLRLRGEAELAP
jgi:hypothetical protein